MASDELPPLNTRLTGDVTGLADTLVKGKALVQEFKAAVASEFGGGLPIGERLGSEIGDGIGRGIQDSAPLIQDQVKDKIKDPVTKAGKDSGLAFSTQFRDGLGQVLAASPLLDDSLVRGLGDKGSKGGEQFSVNLGKSVRSSLTESTVASMLAPLATGLDESLSKGVEPGLADVDRKVTDQAKKTGEKAGQAAANGMSPLLLTAFTLAGTVGPAALLAGTSAAVVGAGALISRSNADIRAEYKTLASDVGTAMTNAVAPLAPAIQASMVQADDAVLALAPVLKQTFADAEPDVSALTQGVTGLATSALPGVRDAIDQSRGIVSGFAGSLPTLGSGVGRFFTGLTTNAQSTEKGIVDFVDVSSNALGTLGHVAGSASAALSTDFSAVTPVLNTTLGVINQLASPPVIGGLLGVGAALKFDPAISGGLQKVSNGLTTVAAKAEGSAGLLGKAGGAAESAAGGFGKMADVMGGPWGVAIGAGVGLLGGLVSNLTQAKFSVSDFTAGVAADNGVVGSNTTKIIQNQLAKLDLKTAQDDLGVSQATLIEYASGEKSAQDAVNTAYNKKIAALKASGQVSAQNTAATVQGNIAAKAESDQLHGVMADLDQMTGAVQQALKSQNDQNQAFLAASRSAGIFAGMVDTASTALETNANQSAINTVAALHLGAGQTQLQQSLADVDSQFLLNSADASAYGSILNAQFGKYQSYSDAVAAFTISLKEQSKQLTAGKDAIDLSTDAGAKNEQILSAMAKQNYQVAESLLAQTGSQDQANKALQAGAAQIDQVAKNAHFTQTQIDALNMALYGTKNIGDIRVPISADTGPATQELNNLLHRINTSHGTVQVTVNTTGLGMGTNRGAGTASIYDSGGWTKAAPGQPEPAVVHGGEYVLSQDMLAGRQAIDPRALAAIRASMAGVGVGASSAGPGSARGSAASGAGGVTVIAPIYLDGRMIGHATTSGTRAGAQQFARHNAITGLAGNYN